MTSKQEALELWVNMLKYCEEPRHIETYRPVVKGIKQLEQVEFIFPNSKLGDRQYRERRWCGRSFS